MAGHTLHLGSHEVHWQGHQERHNVSDVMIIGVALGLAFTVLSIVMMRTGAYDGVPWHSLAIGVGIPSALTASFVCLRRGWEDTH